MFLSILIPTLEQRSERFAALCQHLQSQIQDSEFKNQVEVLWLTDNGEQTVGHKRNVLLKEARGRFVSFVDDDDWVSDNYVKHICEAIQSDPEVDCIGIKGIVTFAGNHPCEFIHSLRYQDYHSSGNRYFRPPYHLNPIRRSIASCYSFEDISYSEDIDWAMQIRDDRALRREIFIDEALYYYYSRRRWGYQWLLDRSESLRHALGLRLSNRIRLKRSLNSALVDQRTNTPQPEIATADVRRVR